MSLKKIRLLLAFQVSFCWRFRDTGQVGTFLHLWFGHTKKGKGKGEGEGEGNMLFTLMHLFSLFNLIWETAIFTGISTLMGLDTTLMGSCFGCY